MFVVNSPFFSTKAGAVRRFNIFYDFFLKLFMPFKLLLHKMDLPASGISASFDVKDWPSGVYVITIHTQGGNVTKKLVVQ